MVYWLQREGKQLWKAAMPSTRRKAAMDTFSTPKDGKLKTII